MSFEHVFNELEIAAEPFALCELQGRCDMGLGRRSGATLHYVLAGRGEILFRGRPPVGVKRGTLILVPANILIVEDLRRSLFSRSVEEEGEALAKETT